MSEKVVRIFEETLRQRWGVEWLFPPLLRCPNRSECVLGR
jgi:hypothetical protein